VNPLSHIELPTIVYKSGGTWPGPRHPDGSHTTFSILGCETHDDVAAALNDGWSLTAEEACWGWSVHDAKADAPPTRDEMLAMAEKLDLRVDKRWSDETLLAKIDAAIAELEADGSEYAMSYTKRQYVLAAFEEAGMAASTFDLTPQMLSSACARLDAMMATWNGKGIRLAYPLPSSPEDVDLDAETSVPDSANEAIITNLALRIAPSYGKTPSVMTLAVAKAGYDVLLSRAAMPGEMQLPRTLPAGAGNKPWRYDDPYMPAPTDPVRTGPEGSLDLY